MSSVVLTIQDCTIGSLSNYSSFYANVRYSSFNANVRYSSFYANVLQTSILKPLSLEWTRQIYTASQIEMAIKHLQATTHTPWLCHLADMETFSIPAQLEQLLVCLLTADPNTKHIYGHQPRSLYPRSRCACGVTIQHTGSPLLSHHLVEDMVYAVTCGH